ncbi:hypothetical protein F4779DRAFT_21990 [Xylariaceae sp. FL0662B]|nr:hypothetical protein F4779DRAFT_21990 [Xylariaceae sp. FL0662B]
MRRSILLAYACIAVVGAIPPPQPQATPPPRLEERQQQPFSIPGVIPSAVDTRFYSVDGSGTTNFIGSTTAYLTVPTVTGTSNGQTVTTTQTASVAIFSAKPDGQSDMEYSLIVAPELADEIKAIVLNPPTKRDLYGRAVPWGMVEALMEVLGPKIATTILRYVNLGVISGVTGVSAVAAGVVQLGPVAVAGAGFLIAVANQFALIADLLRNGGKATAVVVPMDQLRDTKDCPNQPPKCNTCNGNNLMCTSGSNDKCPCVGGCEAGEEKPICSNSNCNGIFGNVCTIGDKAGCMCDVVEDMFVNYVEIAWLDEQQSNIQAILNSGSDGPSGSYPTCGSIQSVGLAGYIPPGHVQISDSDHKTPREVLYMMRETLCNDKCENPPSIQAKSVKATKKGESGCEIAVALAWNMEVFAVRDLPSQGDHWQNCWDSLANATEKCTTFIFANDALGWVNGPDDYEFYQIGYRSLNGNGALHSQFSGSDALTQWCGDSKPKCDTCYGGASKNRCTQGEFSGCDCEPVTATQPEKPKVTNCATAFAAAQIVCCGWSKDTQKSCANMLRSCGVDTDLDAQCQSPVDPSGLGTYSACGQANKEGAIVKGSQGDNIATCLNSAFDLKAEFKYFS